MSDPVTNVEMQDVLSSIRRLVTENARSAPRKEFPVEKAPKAGIRDIEQDEETLTADEDSADDGRLVLTPSLRVMPPPDTESTDVSDGDPDEAEVVDFQEQDRYEQPGEDGGTREPFEEEPEMDAVADFDRDDAEDSALADGDVPEDDLADLDMPWLKPAEDSASEELRARFDAVEHAVEDDYEPDAPGDSAYAGTETGRLDWNTPRDATSDETDPDADKDMAEEYAAMTEQLEEGARDYIGRAVEKELGSDIGILPDDAQIMDEDALRDLVADIVRQELQGALGERITRNVRKLVRREIHRALAAAELD